MIPRRIKLKGFMSFRDEVELLFDGPPLWVLAGENGSGKSAILDAMAFALYGVRRTNDIELEGTRNTKSLINHYEPGLEVEFEFALGAESYVVKRTLPKRGKPSFQVYAWQEPSGNGKGRARKTKAGYDPVPGTELKSGFEDWVDKHVGLDVKAFSAAVLLRQGKTDALLCHKPEARHKILSRIIDISAYERLYHRAKDHHERSRSDASAIQRQLDGVTAVDEAEVARLDTLLSEAREKAAAAQKVLEEVIALKADVTRWNNLSKEREEVGRAVLEAADLLDRRTHIECSMRRAEALGAVLPLLDRYLEAKRSLSESESAAAGYERDVLTLSDEVSRLNADSVKAEGERDRLRGLIEETERIKTAALTDKSELSVKVQILNEMDRLEEQVRQCNVAIAGYSPDLDDLIDGLRRQVISLDEMSRALVFLDQYTGARHEWSEAREKLSAAESQAVEVKAQQAVAIAEKENLEADAHRKTNLHGKAKDRLTELRLRLGQAEERRDRFASVEGEKTCSYCGQILDAAHLETERHRIGEELQQVQQELRAAQSEEQSAEQAAQSSAVALEACAERARRLKEEERRLDEIIREARRELQRAEKQGWRAVEQLPRTYATHLTVKGGDDDIQTCFRSGYPSAEDLAGLHQQASQRDGLTGRLAELTDAQVERGKMLSRLETVAERLSELRGLHAGLDGSRTRRAYKAADSKVQECDQRISETALLQKQAEQLLKIAEKKAKAAQVKWQAADARARQERGRCDVFLSGVTQREMDLRGKTAELKEVGCVEPFAFTAELLEAWQTEVESLNGVEDNYRRLHNAVREVDLLQQRKSQIEQDIEGIPQDARCAVSEFTGRERTVRAEFTAADSQYRAVEKQRQILEERRERRAKLESEYTAAALKESLYKELMKLLGPEYLQRYLLQRAEVGIVDAANEVLDRISGNTLQLRLTESDGATGGDALRVSNKALDLVAIHSPTGDEPIPVESLSGGQRFRVAVSLALGIGRYASNGASRVESVMIDEGFGSLDKKGRREMIDEMHTMRDELKRVILVSHEEEITDAFQNRYFVELRDKSSRVSLVE
jgi:DNA repair exonuclease SbcCD ATPase subunit